MGVIHQMGFLVTHLGVIVVFFLFASTAVASYEASALLDIKAGIEGDPNGFLSSWDRNRSLCSWRGVSCRSTEDGFRVSALNLTGAGLSGFLSPSIGKLTSLVRLDLADNSFGGYIPRELTQCKLLEYIDLGSNLFNGSIPEDILQGLPSLRYLSVHDNNLSGSIPAGIPWSLEYAYLNTNNFSGELSSISGDCRLSVVYLHENAVSGSLPSGLSKCVNLSQLVLSTNDFRGVLSPELGQLENLKVLMVSSNHFEGQIPASLGRCLMLETLDLSYNSFTGSIPTELGNCSSLSVFSLADNKVSGTVPRSLCSSQSLTGIDFTNNMLSGGIPRELGECSMLQYLSLSQNLLNGSIPRELGKLRNLWQLWLAENNLTGSIPRELFNISGLSDLRLSVNKLTGTIPRELSKLTHLEKLYLDVNELDGELPPAFGRHSNLSEVELSFNRLTGEIPSSMCSSGQLLKLIIMGNLFYGDISGIANCTTIQRLRLSNNRLNGTIPREFGRNKALNFLDLAENRLHGPISKEIGQCSNLSSIDLSGNQLSGNIPPEFNMLSKLERLNLARNMLNGSIPSELGECHSITFLDFSNNNLEGGLPEGLLSNLTMLQNLRLASNKLSGRIPEGFFRQSAEGLLDVELGDNKLEGSIPSSIGQLRYLSIALNLSWNSLSGPIPAELGNLDRLQELDLSHNFLAGEIPQQLSSMVSLISANLSFNKLAGELPRGPWAQLLSSSFVGNSGLCMFSNNASCSTAPPSPSSSSRGRSRVVLGVLLGMSGLLFVIILLAWIKCWRSSSAKRQQLSRRRLDSIKLFGDSRRALSLRDITSALTMLSEENVIGRGAHGVVYKVTASSGYVFAVKKLLAGSGKDALDSFERELETAGKFRHRNLVKILAYRSGPDLSVLIYEYMPKGSLSSALYRHGDELGWEVRCKIALGAAQGLCYLHHDCVPMVIHRDIKSSNILLDEEMEAKISDFGIAKLIKDDDIRTMSALVGTYGYIAPEYCYTMRVTEKVDVYAFGVVLLELVTGKSPFDPGFVDGANLVSWVRDELQRTRSVQEIADPVLIGESTDVMKMVAIGLRCTAAEPNDRPSMREVVQMLSSLLMENKEVKD